MEPRSEVFVSGTEAGTSGHEPPEAGDSYGCDADEFSILGPIEVATTDGPLEIGGPRERAALAVLVAWAGQVVSPERLAGALWGDDPPRSGGKVVQNVVLRLR